MAASIPVVHGSREMPAIRRAVAHLRLIDAARMGQRDSAAWDELGDEAEPAGVFAEPWFVRRSLEHCDSERTARLAVVEAPDGRWLGALPVVPVARQGRSPLPAWAAWSHPNRFAGTPLVRRGQAGAFWRGLIDGLGRAGQGRVALCLRDLPLDDPVNRALLEDCARTRRPLTVDRKVGRARLAAGPGDVVPELCAKQASRIRGLERKLEREVGPVELALVDDAARIEETLSAFLALERAGWKGAAGSAMACAEQTRGFFLAVAREAAARGCFEAGVLRAGGQVLAIATQLGRQGRLFGFKMAYDEAFASYAPGLLLLNRLTGSFLARAVGDVDSCAAPDQQPISRLWPARRELVDCRVALGGAVRAGVFSGMLACERAARHFRKA
jgi:CelD/BcsL family acetyltransferase involved in cellulose biosynthesis